jgi:pimeloyl-ACP methyl ester carboxylesterase
VNDVMGYSQGGGVGLQLALRHPTLVNKLVSMSATYRKHGLLRRRWSSSVMRMA